jgi:16S rRNA (guanine966-N2)-methyltransferase
LVAGQWLNPGAIVVLDETQKAEVSPVAGLALIDARDYGDTTIRFYRQETT